MLEATGRSPIFQEIYFECCCECFDWVSLVILLLIAKLYIGLFSSQPEDIAIIFVELETSRKQHLHKIPLWKLFTFFQVAGKIISYGVTK